MLVIYVAIFPFPQQSLYLTFSDDVHFSVAHGSPKLKDWTLTCGKYTLYVK